MAGQWWQALPIGKRLQAPDGNTYERRKDGLYQLGSNPAMGGLPKADEAQLTQMTQDAAHTRHLADRAKEFVDAMGHTATGPIYGHVDLPFLGNVNPMEALGKIVDPNLQRLDSINNQTWPELRPIGSGPMRNTEVSGFRTAFPSTANYGPQNQDIANRMGGEAQDAENRATFVSTYVAHGGPGGVAGGLAAYQRWKTSQNGQPAPRAAGNAALQNRSAQAQGQRAPMKIDLDGNPVP